MQMCKKNKQFQKNLKMNTCHLESSFEAEKLYD